ncbi:MAG TPA: MFS transporter [Alphaproteobacteria bacterium]|nr:MFS transporter [Alphaproteobacteria bacterium]
MSLDETRQSGAAAECAAFVTDVPARLDRLPWSRFHWLVVTALGVTWILDGLEVTLVGSLSGVLASEAALGLSGTELGLTASCYVAGAVLGALCFGHLADRLGRKRLFTITVGVYALATILSGLSWDLLSFAVFRFLTGAGIGGEYAAINSAIQELIPARRRGYTDLAINGSFWFGAALGALSAVIVLDPSLVPADRGWRLAFVVGGVLALVVIVLRRYLPESPRWLMTHDRPEEAERVVAEIERRIEAERAAPLGRDEVRPIRLRRRPPAGILEVARTVFVHYRRRAVLGVTLMTAQAFLYNAIFFTYALVLMQFYGIAAERVGWFVLPFALGNALGPLVLGRLFDSVGRKPMITLTYTLSGALVAATGLLFRAGALDATAQTAAWTVIFFVASAAASAAYLTVGESFPLETRALAIAVFYAFGTALGGVVGPLLFGALIDTGSRDEILWGYLLGAALMIAAAGVEAAIGVRAERRPLEEVARPLSGVD